MRFPVALKLCQHLLLLYLDFSHFDRCLGVSHFKIISCQITDDMKYQFMSLHNGLA